MEVNRPATDSGREMAGDREMGGGWGMDGGGEKWISWVEERSGVRKTV